jgi:hypothetical protein
MKLCLPPASRWFHAWLILRSWRWRWRDLPKRRLPFKILHCVKFQETELPEYCALLLCRQESSHGTESLSVIKHVLNHFLSGGFTLRFRGASVLHAAFYVSFVYYILYIIYYILADYPALPRYLFIPIFYQTGKGRNSIYSVKSK